MVRVPVKAGPRLLGVSFNRKTTVPEGRGPSRQANGAGSWPAPGRRSRASRSPARSIPGVQPRRRRHPARQRIFVCYPTTATERSALRQDHPVDARPTCLPPAGARTKTCDACWRCTTPAAKRRTSTPVCSWRLQGILSDFDFLVRVEHDPARCGPGRDLSDQRPRARLTAVLLPVEQHRRTRNCSRSLSAAS